MLNVGDAWVSRKAGRLRRRPLTLLKNLMVTLMWEEPPEW